MPANKRKFKKPKTDYPRAPQACKCEDCGFTTITKTELANHAATTDCFPFGCHVCGRKFRGNGGMHTHIKTAHEGQTNDREPAGKPKSIRVNEPYECADCGFQTEYQYKFEHHITTNPQCKAYKCEVCGVGIRRSNSLRVHMKMHTGTKEFQCQYCEQTFRTTSHRKKHEQVHEGDMKFKCKICGRRFVQKASYEGHMDRMHPPENNDQDNSKTFKCDVCGKKMETEKSLRNHTVTHTHAKILDYWCEYCNRNLYSRRKLTSHIYDYHKDKVQEAAEKNTIGPRKIIPSFSKNISATEPMKCMQCNVSYKNKTKFLKHLITKHNNYYKKGCPFCPEKLESNDDFKEHYEKIHMVDRIYKCRYCPQRFLQRQPVEEHEAQHSGANQCECEICGLSFSPRFFRTGHEKTCKEVNGKVRCAVCGNDFEKTALREHFLIHENPTPFNCIYCEETFTTRTSLDSHLLEHDRQGLPEENGKSDRYPYRCDVCHKQYKTTRNLGNHLLLHMDMPITCELCNKMMEADRIKTRKNKKYKGNESNRTYPPTFMNRNTYLEHLILKHDVYKYPSRRRRSQKRNITRKDKFVSESENSSNSDDESEFNDSNLTDANETSGEESGQDYDESQESDARSSALKIIPLNTTTQDTRAIPDRTNVESNAETDLKSATEYLPLPLVAAIYQRSAGRQNEMLVIWTKNVNADLLLAIRQNSSNCLLLVQEHENINMCGEFRKMLTRPNSNKINFRILNDADDPIKWTCISFGQRSPFRGTKNKVFNSVKDVEQVLEQYCVRMNMQLTHMLRYLSKDFYTTLTSQLQKQIISCNNLKR